MCLAPRCVPNKPVEFLSTRVCLVDCTGVAQWSDLFVSQIECKRQKFSGPVEPSASIQWTRVCSVGSASEVWPFEG